MSLETYRTKRDFAKTREPKGVLAKKRGASFVVQKHAARRLHYDFRLELDGVLLSWAVPKGPSLNPAEKRLAVQTEDHPVAYGDFEGVIPEKEYGGGTVMVWDIGTWKPKGDPRAAYEKGHLEFQLFGKKLRGGFHLVRTRKGAEDAKQTWLLFKAKDDEVDVASGDITAQSTTSAPTGRDLAAIAKAGDRVWRAGRSEEVAAPLEKRRKKKTSVARAPARRRTTEGRSTTEGEGSSELAGFVRALAPTIKFTNLDKVLYDDQGITKGALIAYYALVAEWMLPHIVDRPLSLVRCPNGPKGDCFFQKHANAGTPPEIRRKEIRDDDRKVEKVLWIDGKEGLLAAAQLGALELHVWGSRLDTIECPDRLVFDLDPDPSVPWEQVVEGAVAVRDLLRTLKLESWVKTTGGKGLHVVVPVAPTVAWSIAKSFTKTIAEALVATSPERFTANVSKSARKSKIFIDYLRNGRGATAVAPYSTRSRTLAPVATPVSWKELRSGLTPDAFTLVTVPERLRSIESDPWDGFFDQSPSLQKILNDAGVAR